LKRVTINKTVIQKAIADKLNRYPKTLITKASYSFLVKGVWGLLAPASKLIKEAINNKYLKLSHASPEA